jgi:AcrR family transcriptional regulator
MPGHEPNAHSTLMVTSIVEAATQLFDQRGYGETRMQDIADAMGVTRPSLYYYFKSKEEILAEMLLDLASADKVLDGIDDLSVPPLERLRELMLRIGAQVVDQPARLRIVNRNFGQVPEPFRKDFTAPRRRLTTGLTRTIEAAIKDGTVQPVDPELTTSIIFGAITGIPDWYHPANASGARETVETITSMLLNGIAFPAEGRHDGTVPGVIRRISEDLAYLGHLYEPATPPLPSQVRDRG